MPLQIPGQYVPVIVKIAALPDAAVDELAAALATSPVIGHADRMIAHVAGRVQTIPIDDIPRAIEAILALYRVREFMEVGADEFLLDLVDSIPGIDSEDAVRARGIFARLLGIESLRAFSKGLKLQREGERLYCEAKIFTDVRPVFSNDIAAPPRSAVITHTLKFSYHEGVVHNDFFVMLDGEDLEALRVVIERAQEKSATLRSMMKTLNLMDVGA